MKALKGGCLKHPPDQRRRKQESRLEGEGKEGRQDGRTDGWMNGWMGISTFSLFRDKGEGGKRRRVGSDSYRRLFSPLIQ